VADDVDSAGFSGVAGTPTWFANGRRQYGAHDIDTLTAASRRQGSAEARRADRPGQVDDEQADAEVLRAWSPERAFPQADRLTVLMIRPPAGHRPQLLIWEPARREGRLDLHSGSPCA
jgi:hypothetical protein